MFIMVNGRNKMYMGGFDDPEHAAKCYDKAAIQMRGIKAHTNFSYSKKEVLRILNSRPLFDMERENVSVAWRELRANFDWLLIKMDRKRLRKIKRKEKKERKH